MFIQRFKQIENNHRKYYLEEDEETKDNDRQLPKLRESSLSKWFKVPKFTPTEQKLASSCD